MTYKTCLKCGFAFLTLLIFAMPSVVSAQNMDKIERDRMKDMLKNIKNEVKKNYYDPNFHGIDLEARFNKAQERLNQVATTAQGFGVIAQVLIDFNDSHLYFLPPATNIRVEYGWRMQMVGDKCFVSAVKPGSDAKAKGLKVGDQILTVEGFTPSRKEMWKVNYYYNVISIRQKLNLNILSPKETQPHALEILSKIKKLPQAVNFSTYFRLFDDFEDEDSENYKNRFQTLGNIIVWKMPGFDIDPNSVDGLIEKVKKGNSLILDLRGNGGGYVKTLERLTGYFFEKELKIADLKGRKPMDSSIAKSRGKDVYKGKLIVLVDSRSGSAAEIFARLIQLEKRGKVLGDVSAGAVMQSVTFTGELGTINAFYYGASVTNADVIMSDGKSLENVGVTPDELILPTADDIANQKDPVITRAVEMLGGKTTPETAGKFFPFDWSKK